MMREFVRYFCFPLVVVVVVVVRLLLRLLLRVLSRVALVSRDSLF